MDLAVRIRGDRVRQSRKAVGERRLFPVVASIVKAHGLKPDFLGLMETVGKYAGPGEAAGVLRIRPKSTLEVPPYVLVSAEEYRLIRRIMEKSDNPYLAFARSPEEVLLSARLYATNPGLDGARLLRYDFETLLLCEAAKQELARLEPQVDAFFPEGERGGWMHPPGKPSADSSPAELRSRELRTFIEKVENTEFQTS